jgi:hypothetical protein
MAFKKQDFDDVPVVCEGMTSAGGIDTVTPSLPKSTKHLQYSDEDFIVDPAVPLFDEHSGNEEGLDIDFTPEVLQQIIDNTNHRILDTNDLVPVYIGHIDDDLPEGKQGELVGFVMNLSLGQIGELNPRACIMGDICWLRDKHEGAKEFTRRSIELWLDDPMVIDNLAILKRRPERNLGILFQKNKAANHKYKRSLTDEKDIMAEHVENLPDGNDELVKKIMDKVMACPHMKFVEDMMNKEKESALEDTEEPKVNEEDDDETPAEMEDETDKMPEKEKLKAQRDQSRRQFAKLQDQNKELEGRLAKMERTARIAERKADLLELEATGVLFDMADELEYVSDLDVVRYQKHINKIKKNYSKAPIGVTIANSQAKVETQLATPDQTYKALKTQSIRTF